MKIPDSIALRNILHLIGKDIFKKGDMIRGEVLEVDEDLVLIHIKDLGIIKATSEMPLKEQEGKVLSFLIKDFQLDNIQLKPVLSNMSTDSPSHITAVDEKDLTEVLKVFGIKPSTSSISFLKDMISFNIPITKDNIMKGFWLLDKLEQLTSLKEDLIPVLVSPKENILDIANEDIRNFILLESSELLDNSQVLVNIEEANKAIFNELTTEIKELVTNFPNFKPDNLLQKTVIFFIKYHIKPSLKNIKYFLELEYDPASFSKDFEILEEFNEYKFTNFIKRFIIDNDDTNMEKSNIKYVHMLNRTVNFLQKLNLHDEDSKGKIKELIDKCTFLKEMNRELVFAHIPLNMENDYQDIIISFLKKRKKEAGNKNNLNIFINLNTKNLGNVRISCLVLENYLDIKFSGLDKDDISLFKAKEEFLRYLVESTGYKIRTVEYLIDNFPAILGLLEVSTNKILNLDIKV